MRWPALASRARPASSSCSSSTTRECEAIRHRTRTRIRIRIRTEYDPPSSHAHRHDLTARRRADPRRTSLDLSRRPSAASMPTGGDVVSCPRAARPSTGRCAYSDRSQIALRMLTRGDAVADEALWRQRLEAAVAFRAQLGPDATAYRLVHAEADLLPSLIVDRYGDWLVMQTLSQGMDRRIDDIVRLLVEILHPAGVLARNDPRVRALEGLEQTVGVVYGEVPETIEIEELGIRYQSIPGRGRRRDCFWISGRIAQPLPLRPRPGAGRVQLQRRLRPAAGRPRDEVMRHRHLGGRGRANHRQRGRERHHESHGACGQRLRRAPALRADAANGSTPSSSIRQRSRRTRRRSRKPSPATRTSTCGRSASCRPAARS